MYCTGDNTVDTFDNKIEFHTHIIPYEGDDTWIDNVVSNLHSCLQSNTIPDKSDNCSYCGFFKKLYVELKNDKLK